MIKKMGLIALGLSMILLSGCGSSSSSDTTTTETTQTEESGVTVFTYDLVVGKTYLMTNDNGDLTITFASQTQINFSENGESGTVTYSIDADGVMIISTPDGQGTYTLISAEENGDLNVNERNNNGDEGEILWTLVS